MASISPPGANNSIFLFSKISLATIDVHSIYLAPKVNILRRSFLVLLLLDWFMTVFKAKTYLIKSMTLSISTLGFPIKSTFMLLSSKTMVGNLSRGFNIVRNSLEA